MTLEINKRYKLIQTDIAQGRGLNGVEYLSYKDAIVVDKPDSNTVVLATLKGWCYEFDYIPLNHVVMIQPYVETRRYLVADRAEPNKKAYKNLTKEEVFFNRKMGFGVEEA